MIEKYTQSLIETKIILKKIIKVTKITKKKIKKKQKKWDHLPLRPRRGPGVS